jgi:hypothetical protein
VSGQLPKIGLLQLDLGRKQANGLSARDVSGVQIGRCMLLAISGDVFENNDYDRGRAKING